MTMTMTLTHSEKVNQHQSETWPYGLERRGHNPVKKESVQTDMPCSIGKVCNPDTVDDSAQSHMSNENIRLVLRQIHLNSKGFLSDSPKNRVRHQCCGILGFSDSITKTKSKKKTWKCGRLCVNRGLSSSVHIGLIPRSFGSSWPR